MKKPRIVVFASGSKDGGGSGFENLVSHTRTSSGDLNAEIVGVISNHSEGGVRKRAQALGVSFLHFPGPWEAEAYKNIVTQFGAEWFALSGWLKPVRGLSPKHTFNIHPALLTLQDGAFGGKGMYGHHVHDAVAKALEAGEIDCSGITMHFVTDEYDRGPIFFEHIVELTKDMDAEKIGKAVNALEHKWQPRITNMVVHEEIAWDGGNPQSLKVPLDYQFLPKE